jgi:hypothetical protein
MDPPIQITFGADLENSITHGSILSRKKKWIGTGICRAPGSSAILFAQADESKVPAYRIYPITKQQPPHNTTDNNNGNNNNNHGSHADSTVHEDHRYPLLGQSKS